MTSQQKTVFHKYSKDLKKYLILSFIFITMLLAVGFSLAVLLHGFQTVYTVFPLMWVRVLLGYLAKIPFVSKAKADFRENKVLKAKIISPELTFDGKNCLKVQKGAIIGMPKYTIKGDDGKTYLLYITAEGTDVKDKITFDDGVFEVEFLANCGIVLSVKAYFKGETEDKEDFDYRIGKFLKDYIY